MNYYDELIEEIRSLLDSGDYLKASSLIENELSMAYVPKDVEQKLKEFKNELNDLTSIIPSISDNDIIEYLKGDSNHQLIGCNELGKRNLRDYIDICNDFLNSNGFINAKALLIDSLIRQEVDYNFSYVNNGSLIKFNPKLLKPIEETLDFNRGVNRLEEFYMKDASKQKLAIELLYKEALLALPNEIDSIIVTTKIINFIEDAFSAK